MADDRVFMHNHDNLGRPAIVRMVHTSLVTTMLTFHLSKRIHVRLREWWSGRTPLRIHLLLRRISCGRLVPRRAGFYVSEYEQ
jgi:hypothetical protein